MPSSHDQMRKHFEERAASYDLAGSWVHDSESLDPIAQFVEAIQPLRILEIGVGTGAVPQFLSARGLALNYFGIDLSASMMTQGSGFLPIVADATALPLRDGTFDLVICRQVVHYFEDARAVFREAVRVAGPGGHAVVAQIVPFDNDEDLRWWKTIVNLRQPLRRQAWTLSGLVATLDHEGLAVLDVIEVLRPTSLNAWLDRYETDHATREKIRHRFRSAPDSVVSQRHVCEIAGDFRYLMRWVVIRVWVPGRRDDGD